jgi:hypothetical protein
VRKPEPPPVENAAPTAGEEAMAVTEPKPLEGALGGERPSSSWEEPQPLGSGRAAAPASSRVELIGLDQSAAMRLLGPATERTEEPPAMVWRYKTADCELDLFFYLDLRSGQMRTLRYALKNGDGNQAQQQDCLRSLIESRRS